MLQVHSFTFGPFQENTYLLYDETKEAVIIDPGCYGASEQHQLSSYIQFHHLNVKQLLNTHGHVDHIAGNKYVFDTYGLKPFIHEADLPIFNSQAEASIKYGLPCDVSPRPAGFLKEGESIKFGKTTLSVIHTPGHAPGHVVFYNERAGILINGDVLFRGSIGRTDLPLGDADTLVRSIQQKLFVLPDKTIVYCGHGEPTTIEREKKTNPYVKIQ